MPSPGDAESTGPAVADNTGAARTRIRIEVPPGPGGFAPTIELGYSSRTGDGLLGVGWNLSIPEILCSGRFGAPNLASCETYELNGQPLVRDGSSHTYHTFVESFQRITKTSATTWKVERPDGTKLYFGGPAAYRVVQDGNTARWLLERMEDAFGNEIHFTYDRSDVGSAYPSSISYGAGASAGAGPRLITFQYEPRTDPRIVFTGGLKRIINQRLEGIRVYGHDVLARRYWLEYEATSEYATDRSRLRSVQEFGSDCTGATTSGCVGLPKTTFYYRKAPWTGAGSQWDGSSANDDYRIPFGSYPLDEGPYPHHVGGHYVQLMGDLNGDGLPDRIELEPPPVAYAPMFEHAATVKVWINTGSGFDGPEDTSEWADEAETFLASFNALTYPKPRLVYQQIEPQAPPQPPDWDDLYTYWWGQGQPIPGPYGLFEIYGSFREICTISVTTESTLLASALRIWGVGANLSRAKEFENASAGNAAPGFFEPRPTVRLVDLNADGLADLVVSLRMNPVTRYHDCEGNPVPPDGASEQRITIVYRNTGSGWVSSEEDPEAAALANGMPALEELIVKSSYAAMLELDETQVSGSFGTSFELSTCSLLGVFGFEQPPHRKEGDSGFYWYHDAQGLPAQGGVCWAPINLQPQFHDFNGDGFPDIVLLAREHPNNLVTGDFVNPARSVVWIQKPDAPSGSPRWERATQYDLPDNFPHLWIEFDGNGVTEGCWSETANFPYCGPSRMKRIDSGVRFADLNRDGMTDVVWKSPTSSGEGVLLNTGRGSPSTATSAWCKSNNPSNPALVSNLCAEAARYIPPAPLMVALSDGSLMGAGHFGDINGDGWLDYVSIDPITLDTNSWVFDHGAGSSEPYWRQDADDKFDVQVQWNIEIPYPFDHLAGQGVSPICSRAPGGGNTEKTVCELWPWEGKSLFMPGFQLFDINGDGSADVVSDIQVFLSKFRHSDLLASIDNGRGGLVQIEYESAIQQRSDSLESIAEADAASHAATQNEAIGLPLWRPTPVVSKVTVHGKDFAPSETTYEYARPRFSQDWRTDQGFRLVRTTRPDGSRTQEFFHQDHGRAGRTSRKHVTSDSQVSHLYEATWEQVEPDPSPIPGTIAGVFHARLVSESSRYRYQGADGGVRSRSFFYDDAHGYDFANLILSVRPTGTLLDQRDPDSDTSAWLIGRIAKRTLLDGAFVLADSEFEYDGPKVRLRSDLVEERGAGGGYWVDSEFEYDGFGNLIRESMPSPALPPEPPIAHTYHCYDGDTQSWCGSPAGQSSHSVRVATKDPLENVVRQTPDPARGTIVAIDSTYTDERICSPRPVST